MRRTIYLALLLTFLAAFVFCLSLICDAIDAHAYVLAVLTLIASAAGITGALFMVIYHETILDQGN